MKSILHDAHVYVSWENRGSGSLREPIQIPERPLGNVLKQFVVEKTRIGIVRTGYFTQLLFKAKSLIIKK